MLALKNFRKNCRGFTLIELLMTVAIAAILMMVAVPSMVTYKRNAELTSATNTLFSAINAARGEALKRGTNAMVVPAKNADWNNGWIIFIYAYAPGRVTGTLGYTYDSTYDKLILQQGPMPSYINIVGTGNAVGTAPYIMFDASGYARSKTGSGGGNLTFNLTRTDVSNNDEIRRIKIAVTGRARTCKPSNDATCTATSTGAGAN
ncbi:GspH/FimT family pseudopilin [Rhodoferax sp.]|uniref:GspH/FimT family pseudopilin n=1 Tax=Rhodoferax sp. TaxID=50421 RepID=UPI0025EB8731|nr:GspH/FimT family pseudopilin [Rhodoferax sp.]